MEEFVPKVGLNCGSVYVLSDSCFLRRNMCKWAVDGNDHRLLTIIVSGTFELTYVVKVERILQ